MALNPSSTTLSGLAADRPASVTVTGLLYFATDTGALSGWSGGTWVAVSGGSAAPTDAEYIVGATNSSLSAERLLTNTATVTWDFSVAGQAKATAVGGSGISLGLAEATALGMNLG